MQHTTYKVLVCYPLMGVYEETEIQGSLLMVHMLPPEEQVNTVKGFELVPARPGNSARLVSLTTKLCRRAYRQTAANVHSVRVHSGESFSLLRHSMDLVSLDRAARTGGSVRRLG